METIDLSDKIRKPAEVTTEVNKEGEDWATNLNKYDVVLDENLIDSSYDEFADFDEDGNLKDKKTSKAAEPPAEDKWNPSELADLIVDTIDFAQTKAGEFVHFSTLLTPDQKADLKELITKFGIKPNTSVNNNRRTSLTFYEKWLLERQAAHIQYVELLPFGEDETTRFKNAWRRYLKGKNVEISDGWALVATSASIMIPRLIPVIANLFDKEKQYMHAGTNATDVSDIKYTEELVKIMNALNVDELTAEQSKQALAEIKKKLAERDGKK